MTTILGTRFRRWAAATALMLVGLAPAAAQNDLSVIAITQPVSGCALSSAENVTVRIFNFGNTLPAATLFSVSYVINAGPPTTELVTLATPLLANGTFTYTFTTQANLSVPGSYTVDASVSLAGDVNPANNAFTGKQVQNAAPSVGGTLTGPTTITTSGTLTLAGQVGGVVEWQQSIDGVRWRSLENTTTTQAFAGLDSSTGFRVLVQNAPCAATLSNTLVVNPTDNVFSNGFE